MEHPFAPKKRRAARLYGNRSAKRRESTKDNNEAVSRVAPQRSRSRTPDPTQRNLLQRGFESPNTATTSSVTSTPASAPSTPGLKGRQASTPSSSPQVKLDLEKEVFKLLSPKKTKKQRSHAASDEEESSSSSSSSDGNYPSLSPHRSQNSVTPRLASRTSFAARMAPKAASRIASRPVTPPYQANAVSLTASPAVARSAVPSPNQMVKRDWQVADSLQQTKRKPMRTYGDYQEDSVTFVETQTNVPAQQQIELSEFTAPPDVNAMKARWTDLDEMESEDDGQPYVRSITRLRSAGGNRRFLEEFDYLVSDLHAKQRLAVKQSTCADIARRVMGFEDCDELDDDSPTKTSSFIFNMGAADVIEKLCASLRAVRIGHQPDTLVDTATAIVYSRLAADANLLRQLTAKEEFVLCVSDIFRTVYPVTTTGKILKSLDKLQALVRSSDVPDDCVTPNIIAAQTLVTLLSCTALDIQPEEWGVMQVMGSLWSFLKETNAKADCSLESNASLILIELAAQSLDVILDRFSLSTHPSKRQAEFVTVTKLIIVLSRDIIVIAGSPLASSRTAALSSCMKLLVEMMRLYSDDIDLSLIVLASASASKTSATTTFIEHVADLLNASAHAANEAGEDVVHKLRLLDVSTLALGVLTKLIEAAPGVACSGLLMHNEQDKESIICKLGSLFSEREAKHDKAGEAGLFAHCLAVALSLMVVSAQDKSGEGDDAVQGGRRIVTELSKGMTLHREQHLQHVLADNLDRFAALTSANVQTDLQSTSVSKEDNLVRHLSIRLRDM